MRRPSVSSLSVMVKGGSSRTYASVIMLLDADTFFRPISAVVRVENISVWLDGNPYRLREDSFVPVDW